MATVYMYISTRNCICSATIEPNTHIFSLNVKKVFLFLQPVLKPLCLIYTHKRTHWSHQGSYNYILLRFPQTSVALTLLRISTAYKYTYNLHVTSSQRKIFSNPGHIHRNNLLLYRLLYVIPWVQASSSSAQSTGPLGTRQLVAWVISYTLRCSVSIAWNRVISLEAAAAPNRKLICGFLAPSSNARAKVPIDLRVLHSAMMKVQFWTLQSQHAQKDAAYTLYTYLQLHEYITNYMCCENNYVFQENTRLCITVCSLVHGEVEQKSVCTSCLVWLNCSVCMYTSSYTVLQLMLAVTP